MTTTVMLFDPTASRSAGPSAVQQTLTGLAGKVVGFIDNAKPNFQFLVEDLGDLLVAKYGVARLVKHQKGAASIPATAEVIASFADQCDLVITGSGD